MSRLLSLCLLTSALVALGGCESRTDRSDTGGVLLSVTDFDGLPLAASVNESVNAVGFVQVERFTITNVPLNPARPTSQLMNVEMKSYQVTYTRLGPGSRVPPPLVRGLFGVAPVGGSITLDNLPVLGPEQLLNPPLSDLLFINGGFDRETNSQLVTLNLRVTFFGETLAGKQVATQPIDFAIEFVP
jgi:hypothetical protein